ncbi:uncharacterized protein LTR77_009452 [Saxophila tyrrhenica]|uniref:Uncharacterized protein n=1 Tax=Saxophila tyrrhenica TaxID=1690608 RepID=A0AAV9NXQ1_9PEZI|nr:hypothetical protein LTR77_009452 [Saxophila tyrrhenica]
MSETTYRPIDSDADCEDATTAREHEARSHTPETLDPKEDASSQHLDSTSTPRPCKRPTSSGSIWTALLDFCLVLPPIYFLVFAFLVYSRDQTPVDTTDEDNALLQAAALGPTLFPIAFAAIIGSFLNAVAAWRIERGASVATLEQLLGSKTVFSAVTLPAKLQVFTFLGPLLIALWAISPIGGQASRRIVDTGLQYRTSSINASYLDTNKPYDLWRNSGKPSDFARNSAAYVTALLNAGTLKHRRWDTFRNIKIPMIEYLDTRDGSGGGHEFQNVPTEGTIAWSSLIGVPHARVQTLPNSTVVPSILPANADTSFNLESSYLNADCSDPRLYDVNFYSGKPWIKLTNSSYPEGITLLKNPGESTQLGLEKHSRNSTGPRIVHFQSIGGNGMTYARCALTTTYVESKVQCDGTACSVTAMRRSLNPWTPSHLTLLDFSNPGYQEGDRDFFINWLEATPGSRSSTWASPSDIYFSMPDNPFTVEEDVSAFSPDIADLDKQAFQLRFAQLLNTAYIAGVSPRGATGVFNPGYTLAPANVGQAYPVAEDATRYAQAIVQHSRTVLRCHYGWFAVLVLSSLLMLAAAIAAMTFNLLRQGPDILTSFSSLLRDNCHIDLQGLGSMADGLELSRAWARERVALGDVAPEKEVGHIAITRVNSGMTRLMKGRMYD